MCKQYFKEGLALRTELVICDTNDLGIGRRVRAHNWYAHPYTSRQATYDLRRLVRKRLVVKILHTRG